MTDRPPDPSEPTAAPTSVPASAPASARPAPIARTPTEVRSGADRPVSIRPVSGAGGGAPPTWRTDFPITSAGEDEVTRRAFVRYLVLASGGFAAGSVGIALWSSLRSVNVGDPRRIVDLDRVAEGASHLFRYPTDADPAILVHLPGGELRAFSQKCTHLGCVIYYKAGSHEMECPCHEGKFDAVSGDVISGPPQRPLGRIDVEVRDGAVWALANRGEGEE